MIIAEQRERIGPELEFGEMTVHPDFKATRLSPDHFADEKLGRFRSGGIPFRSEGQHELVISRAPPSKRIVAPDETSSMMK